MTDHEAVLCDLLLECGVEGVTLWHIRCLASHLRDREPPHTWRQKDCVTARFESDLRGEEAVLAEAWAEWSLRMQPEPENHDSPDQFGGSDYP